MEYLHGGDIYTNRVELDYSANLNPLGPPEGVKRAYAAAVTGISVYPDSRCGRLRRALSEFHGVNEEAVICGNGAAELIYLLAQAVKPKRAMVLAPSFLEYRQALFAAECEILRYDLKEREGFALSVPALLDALKEQEAANELPKLLFLCNPNNPTGLGVRRKELLPLIEYCEERAVICVIDECFNEFLEEPERYSLLEELRLGKFKRLFILKAFTKVYAIAGLRLGYGLCLDGQIFEAMERFRQPWSVSGPAQAAGVAALLEREYVRQTRELVKEERCRLKEGLRKMGFYVYDSLANYIFFRDDSQEEGELYRQCLRRGLLIRSCSNYQGIDGRYYRICVGNCENNARLLRMFQAVREERR